MFAIIILDSNRLILSDFKTCNNSYLVHNMAEKLTSSYAMLAWTKILKPENNQFIITYDKKKHQHLLIVWKLELEDVLE